MEKVQKGEKHFTSSVWIISKTTPKKVLLVLHKKTGKWQQPGGHIERFENPIDAAVREVKEETGLEILNDIGKEIVVDDEGSLLPNPEFLLEHRIAPFGDEPEHYHIDLNFVVEIDMRQVKQNKQETDGIRWFTKDEVLGQISVHGDTKEIVEKIL